MKNEKENILDKLDNRENILNCALHLFYSKGYDAVGVQEIAETAGVTKPTLYYYFKSKYGLLESLLEIKCKALNEEIYSASLAGKDVLTKLFYVAEAYLKTAAINREFYFLMLALFYSARENEAYRAIKPHLARQFALIRELFENEAKQLGNMNGRQEQFAIGFMGIINHYILVYYEREEDTQGLLDKKIAYSLVHQFMYGIYS